MGCVSSKSANRCPDRASALSLPVSRHRLVSDEDWDVGPMHSVSVPSPSSEALNKESFFNIKSKLKLCKTLSREKSLHFLSHSDHTFTKNHRKSVLQPEEKKETSTCSSRRVMKPVAAPLMPGGEGEDERQHFLMSDFLQMQHLEMPHCGKASLHEDECRSTLLWADRKFTNARTHPKRENLDAKHVSASKDLDAPYIHVDRSESARHRDTEIIDMQELMEGLDDNTPTPFSCRSQDRSMLSIPDGELSFNVFPDLMADSGGDFGSPVWKKYYMLDTGVFSRYSPSPAASSPFNESPRRASLQTPFSDVDDSRSATSIEPLDVNAIGLKILLSPSNSSFHPSPVNRAHTVDDKHMTNAMCDANLEQFSESFHNVGSPYQSQKQRIESTFGLKEHENAVGGVKASGRRTPDETRLSRRMPSMEGIQCSGSPLFDPSLLATFEHALKASMIESLNDDWLSNETLTLSPSASTCNLFNTSIEEESTRSDQTTEKRLFGRFYGHEIKSKVTLSSYEIRCPPRGEGKVVLYFTSLRGIRKTFEDCFNLRLILRGLGIQVDERDVWMHSEFRTELYHVLDGLFEVVPQVPQLFVKGRYIGGADQVKQLHEEGILSCFMDGLPMGLIQSICKGCGDARFIPCFTCNGSRKVLNAIDEFTECPACNENGLTMCPICIM